MNRIFFSGFFIAVGAFFFVGATSSAYANTPNAVVGVSINGAPAALVVQVPVDVPVHVRLYASQSSDPDGWTTPGSGVSNGGQCAWNTSLGRTTPIVFDKVISNPSSPGACNIDLGMRSFRSQSGVNQDRFNLLRITDASGNVSANGVAFIRTVSNHAPLARAQWRASGTNPSGTTRKVTQGVPVTLVADGSLSSDSDEWTTPFVGVSQGGKCEWNSDLDRNASTSYETVNQNPSSPSKCGATLTNKIFNDPPGIYTYNMLRITDASGAVSNIATLSIEVLPGNSANIPPTSSPGISANGSVPSASITVRRGTPVHVTLDASKSTDGNGWTDPSFGVSQGGQCLWNADLQQGENPTYERAISNPSSPAACNIDLGTLTFNDPAGTYLYRVLRIKDAAGALSAPTYVSVIVTDTNTAPIAVSKIQSDSSVYGTEVAVTQGVPAHIRLSADASYDPNGWTTPSFGVSQGGRCQWNTDFNTGPTTFERTIGSPLTSGACNIDLGLRTFNDEPGRYVYPVLRITDASGAVSNIASVTVVVISPDTNVAPVAVAKFSVDDSAPSSHIYVSRGVPVRIGLDAASSYDPNGWNVAQTGMSQGGKCEWNTNLDQSRPTPFIRTITDPASPAACNLSLGTLIFNDPPGTYTYVLLRLTDAGGFTSILANADRASRGMLSWFFPSVFADSADGSAMITVVDGPTPTPTSSTTPLPCDPFGYNTNCPTPTVFPTPTVTPSVEPTPALDPTSAGEQVSLFPFCFPGLDCEKIGGEILKIIDAVLRALGNLLQALFGIDPSIIAKFFQDNAAWIESALAILAMLLLLPFLIANLFPHIAEGLRNIGFFFARKKKDRWGIVVDSDLGNPIAGAVVQVFDSKFNQLKETGVTGPDGQFGFLMPPGQYYIIASHADFVFPATKKPPTVLRDRERIYGGEEFTITDQDAEHIPHFVVPMDREEKVSALRARSARYFERIIAFLDRIGFVLLFVGAGINTYLLLMQPSKLNLFFEVLYIVLFALKIYVLLFHQRGVGTVLDATTHRQLDLAIIRVYQASSNRIVQTRVTNKHGYFFLLVPKGVYVVSVSKAGYETLVLPNVKIKGSVSKALSFDFSLKPQGEQPSHELRHA